MKVEAVIFDYNRTLVEGENFPPSFFPETLSVLRTLHERGIKMAVVSVGRDRAKREEEFRLLKLRELGISVFKIVAPEETKDLKPVLNELQVNAQACLVVGDRIKKEIIEGNKVGATTIWLAQGLYVAEKPERPEEQPNYTIKSIGQLIPLIESFES